MALKGTTRIELTNVKTGKTEVIEKHNLVTNAIPDLLTLNPDGYLWTSGKFGTDMNPICPNAIGGILLYENPLEEDPDKYYAPDTNPVIGYSSNDVNSGTDVKRGSMNQTESGPLEDHSGYRFVFDFATSQANGTISALGLTSKWGGASGYGSLESYGNNVVSLSDANSGYIFKTLSYKIQGVHAKYEGIAGLTADRKYGVYALVAGRKQIEVGKIRIPIDTVPLAVRTLPNEEALAETQVLNTTVFADTSVVSTGFRYYNFMDGGDGCIWGFEHAGCVNGNASAPATLNWVKISKEDFSFEEGSMVVNAQLYGMGRYVSELYQYAYGDYEGYSIIHNGFLYCLNYSRTGIVKIELANPTNVIEMLHPEGRIIEPTISNNDGSATCLNVNGNTVYFANGYIENDKIIPAKQANITSSSYAATTSYPRGLRDGKNTGIRVGPFIIKYMVSVSGSSVMVYRFVLLMAPYLATINNLEKPVQKTADKTMKITYILREEPENTEL